MRNTNLKTISQEIKWQLLFFGAVSFVASGLLDGCLSQQITTSIVAEAK